MVGSFLNVSLLLTTPKLLLLLLVALTVYADADGLADHPSAVRRSPDTASNWSLQIGAAFISQNNIGEVLSGQIEPADGETGGQSYSLTLTWIAHRFEIPFRDGALRPQFEPYFTLTLVDENGRSPFPDYNAGLGFRWVDFPWNDWVSTTFFTGLGLSYSTRVYAIDRQRHAGMDRSHLKLDWPLQFIFALPAWPQHQLVLFNDHHSGGHIFDEGGVNSLGIGYRLEF
jgi:hypothetical protein